MYGLIDSLPTIRAAKYNVDSSPAGPDFHITTAAAYEWFSFDWGIHLGRLERVRDTSVKSVTLVTVLPSLRDGGLEVS